MLLELRNIKKYFSSPQGLLAKNALVRAVDDVSLSVAEGENVGIVGESGSGKTTLARLILKLYKSDAGQIILNGQDIAQLSAGQMRPLRHQVQMIFQDPYSSLDPRYTIYSILKEALSLEKSHAGDHEKRIVEVLTQVDLPEDTLARYPHEFSGGERQRIAIARALLMRPRLLILDEAVSSLDVLVQAQILELLLRLQKSSAMTYIFISHNLRVIRKVCQRIAVMYQGKIVELAAAEELFRNPLHPYTKELLAAAINYQAVVGKRDWPVAENSVFRDIGNGHFVVD